MALKKIQPGSSVTRFPAGTFNQLIAGELRDRQRQTAATSHATPGLKSPVIVRIKWNGAETILPGAVVVLGEVLVKPEDRPSAPYEGLQFNADEFADGDESKHTAIMLGPVEPDGIGYGHMAPAVWAKVFVSDEDHKFAKPRDGESVMGSGSSGMPIIWKEPGVSPEEPEEGEDPNKWAVVDISGKGKAGGLRNGSGGVTDIQMCAIYGEVPACTWSVGKTGDVVDEITRTPGISEDPVVVPMLEAEEAETYVAEKWPEGHADEGKPMFMVGHNYAQRFPLKGGDGAEGTGEAAGTFANEPIWGWGYQVKIPAESEEEEDEYFFKIMKVENPCVIYEATLDTAMADTDADVTVTPTADIWANRPVGKRTAKNLHEWFANSGAKAQILRGYDRDTILNVTGVCEDDFVPEEE